MIHKVRYNGYSGGIGREWAKKERHERGDLSLSLV